MSVESSYFSVDWPKLQELPAGIDLGEFLWEAVDEEPWLSEFPFGPEIDDYYFSSTRCHIFFSDWFRDVRSTMDPALVEEFSSLFMDFGILYDDTHAPVPIFEQPNGFVPSGDWLIGLMPPTRVVDLYSRAKKINLLRVRKEFQRALEQTPCEVLEEGAVVVDWIRSLTAGLEEVAGSRCGVVMGMA